MSAETLGEFRYRYILICCSPEHQQIPICIINGAVGGTRIDQLARLIYPLVQRDNYGKSFTGSVTPPDLQRAYYASNQQEEVVLEFDQPVKWDDALASRFCRDGQPGQIASGKVSGKVLTLQLPAASTARNPTALKTEDQVRAGPAKPVSASGASAIAYLVPIYRE